MTVVSQAGCKEMFQHIEGTHYPWDGDTMVCAGGADTDACQVKEEEEEGGSVNH